MVMPGSALGVEGKSLPDASQTWDWPDVDEALGRARGSVLVVEMFGGPFGARDRAAALVGVVAALSAPPGPLAVAGPPASASRTRTRRRPTGSAGW